MIAAVMNVTAIVAMSKKKSSAKKSKAPIHKQSYWDAVNVMRAYLNLSDGEPFPTYLLKKFKELSYYDDDVLYETILQCKTDFDWASTHRTFNSMINRINYFVAIMSNKISDVNKQYERMKKLKAKSQTVIEKESPVVPYEELSSGCTKQQDVSNLLGGDDLWT